MFEIVEKLGGLDRCKEILTKRGLPLTDEAYAMWKSRREIPVKASLVLEIAAIKEGVAYHPRDFCYREDARRRPRTSRPVRK